MKPRPDYAGQRFGIDLYTDAHPYSDKPFDWEYFTDLDAAKARARTLYETGRFTVVEVVEDVGKGPRNWLGRGRLPPLAE